MMGRTFEVERLSIGHWPRTVDAGGLVIPKEAWSETAATVSAVEGTPVFSVDVTPDRDMASIGVAGRRPDGLWHVAVDSNAPGTAWLVDRCRELKRQVPGARFLIDSGSPAAALIQELRNARVRVKEIGSQEYVRACQSFYDAVVDRQLRHLAPQPELDAALAAATKRPVGDSWAWGRRNLTDISPLVAVTVALYGASNVPTPRVVNLNA